MKYFFLGLYRILISPIVVIFFIPIFLICMFIDIMLYLGGHPNWDKWCPQISYYIGRYIYFLPEPVRDEYEM